MPAESNPPYRFSDLVALARLSWLDEMTRRLEELGFPGFRRGDSATMRALRRGPLPVGRLGDSLGVTRQAARKIADALEQRGYVTTERDARDTRQLNVVLTPAGRDYARAVIGVADELNQEIAGRVSPAQLAAADAVLRAALFDDRTRERASHLPPPPALFPPLAVITTGMPWSGPTILIISRNQLLSDTSSPLRAPYTTPISLPFRWRTGQSRSRQNQRARRAGDVHVRRHR